MPKAKKQKNGKWRCQLYIGDEYIDGKRRQIVKSFTAPTKSEAEMLAYEYKRTFGTRSVADLTVSDAMRRYIDAKSNVLSETTLKAYESQLEHYYGMIKDVRIRDLTLEQVQLWLNDFSVDHTRSTAKKAASFLNSSLRMFGGGYDAKLLTHKSEKAHEIEIPTVDEVWDMYNNTPLPDLRKAVLLAAFGGLRRSEMCALDPADIDHKQNRIRINKGKILTRDKEWIVKDMPKTDCSVRTVMVPAFVTRELLSGTITTNPDAIGSSFKRLALRVCGRSFGIHTLRHFYASQLHYAGIPQRTIERMGGWRAGSPVLTQIYQNAIRDEEAEQERRAVEALAKRKSLQSC